jgi:type IV secretory pathway VirB10-like protein
MIPSHPVFKLLKLKDRSFMKNMTLSFIFTGLLGLSVAACAEEEKAAPEAKEETKTEVVETETKTEETKTEDAAPAEDAASGEEKPAEGDTAEGEGSEAPAGEEKPAEGETKKKAKDGEEEPECD